jgi:hypothetical protein
MGVKNLVSYSNRTTWIEGVTVRCWGEYFDLRGRKWWEAREDCIMRSSITCMLHQILLG